MPDLLSRACAGAALGFLLLGAPTAASQPSDAGQLAAASEPLAEPPPPDAATVRSGSLRDGDPVHRGSGSALLLQHPDGRYFVRLEQLEVVPGPDLFVYLVVHQDPLFPEDVTAGFHDLGPLKSRFGDQNYAVPADVDPANYGSVVVWCDSFKVQFAVAALN